MLEALNTKKKKIENTYRVLGQLSHRVRVAFEPESLTRCKSRARLLVGTLTRKTTFKYELDRIAVCLTRSTKSLIPNALQIITSTQKSSSEDIMALLWSTVK